MVSRFSGKVFTTERGIPRNGVCCSKSSVGTEWEVNIIPYQPLTIQPTHKSGVCRKIKF